MPNQKPSENDQKRVKREQNGSPNTGGQERQTGGFRQDPTQKGDRERQS